jgi:hypothetical protein
MRVFISLVAGGCIAASVLGNASPAFAAPAAGTAYFTFYENEGLMGELPVDATLKATRQGGKLVSGVLDVCHSLAEDSDRKDRFVVNLKSQGGKLVGTAESQEEKLPVSVSLAIKQSGSNFAFEGTITRGTAKLDVSVNEKGELSEEDFRQAQPEPDTLIAAPKDFTEVAPDSLVVKVKRGSLSDLVKALRGEDVELGFQALATGCDVLRAGVHSVKIDVDPERAPALLAKLKGLPGVTEAGWGLGTYGMDHAIRFPAADWRDADGKVAKEKLATAIGDAVAKSLSAKLRSSEWDKTSGDLSLKLERPDASVPGVDLVQQIEISMLLGPETPGKSENLILWVGDVTGETVDEASGPHLKFSGASVGGGGEGEEDQSYVKGDEAVMPALVGLLKGKSWDSEKSAWK